jgi:hypothetical protein
LNGDGKYWHTGRMPKHGSLIPAERIDLSILVIR